MPTSHVKASAWLYGGVGTLGAIAVASLALFGGVLSERLPRGLVRPVGASLDALRKAHSGHVGDYVAWWTFGVSALGGLFLWAVTS